MKALARAHRWKRLLESGRYAFLGELAAAEKIDRSYLGKMLRLTLLAPDIVEVLLDGKQPQAPELRELLKSFPHEWSGQQALLQDLTRGHAALGHSLRGADCSFRKSSNSHCRD